MKINHTVGPTVQYLYVVQLYTYTNYTYSTYLWTEIGYSIIPSTYEVIKSSKVRCTFESTFEGTFEGTKVRRYESTFVQSTFVLSYESTFESTKEK